MSSLLRKIPVILVTAAILGCSSPPRDARRSSNVRPDQDAVRMADRENLKSLFDDQIRRGIETQRAIFEYHFRPRSAELTLLGSQDLAVLAKALERDGGWISVERGGASPGLYAARLSVIRDGLRSGGVGVDRIMIEDGLPGGRGVSSGNAVRIRSEIRLNEIQVPDGELLKPLGGSEEVMP